jgi:hypothetical protein
MPKRLEEKEAPSRLSFVTGVTVVETRQTKVRDASCLLTTWHSSGVLVCAGT